MSGILVGKVRVLVVEDEQGQVERLRSLLHGEDMELFVATRQGDEVLPQAPGWSPDVILVALTHGSIPKFIEKLDAAYDSSPIVALLSPEQTVSARDVLLAGARAYLTADPGREELVDTILSVLERERRRRAALAKRLGVDVELGQIIAVHGAKGGVGATSIAVNLAVATQLAGRTRVALVDANLYSGDVAASLNLMARSSLADLTPHLKDLDQDFLERASVRHSSGLHVFLAPDDLVRAQVISGEQITRILKVMRQHYNYIIVDTCSLPDQVTTAALEEANQIILVLTPELPALKNAARFLQLAGEFGYQGKITVALNRANSRGALSLRDIKEHLRIPVAVSLGSDGRALVAATNAGLPVVTQRRGRFADGVWHLTATMTGVPARQLKRRREQPSETGSEEPAPVPTGKRVGVMARLRPGQ